MSTPVLLFSALACSELSRTIRFRVGREKWRMKHKTVNFPIYWLRCRWRKQLLVEEAAWVSAWLAWQIIPQGQITPHFLPTTSMQFLGKTKTDRLLFLTEVYSNKISIVFHFLIYQTGKDSHWYAEPNTWERPPINSTSWRFTLKIGRSGGACWLSW